jgi:ParB/RepB/Spo0J family partition protein
MPDFREIEVALLVPPERPMRSESLYQGLYELKESMATHGLQQPIGVRAEDDGSYMIIWGMRRSLAARELGWETIPARVYAQNEGEPELLMAHENFHRTQLDPVEEAEFYAELLQKHSISIAEVARRCRRSVSHVHQLLDLLAGDADVLYALRDGAINRAQATEINRFDDQIGRGQALKYAREDGMTAGFIRRWREDREKNGLSANAETVQALLDSLPANEMQSRTKCYLHNGWVEIQNTKIQTICDECLSLVAVALEHYQQCRKEGERGERENGRSQD